MKRALLLLGSLITPTYLQAQAPPSAPRDYRCAGTAAAAKAATPGHTEPDFASPDSFKPYATVIPPDAQTRCGFLITHLVGERLYFEIPPRLLNIDMLLTTRLDQRIVRWERRGTRVLLRIPETLSPDDSAYAKWLDTGSHRRTASILDEFPIETSGPEGSVVIDVTPWFLANPEFDSERSIDARRSFIDRVEAHPDNVFIQATLTYTADGKAVSYRPFWNVVRLPARLMRPRLYDARLGFFVGTRAGSDLGFGLDKEESGGYILRWRLEKKNPRARVSEPVKPIIFYLDPATPAKWRPWIKAGVEAWRPALEAAGFKNAIIARDPPAKDSNWSVNDVRHSLVSWSAAPAIEGRRRGGASIRWIKDGRTGEVLHAVVDGPGTALLNTLRLWYVVWVGPLDPRTRQLPLPDSLAGALMQRLVAHEVGHALGLQDGHYGKLAYSVDSLRSRTWLRRMGFTPSVLNYSRYNYVAQPEDSIPVAELLQRVGPADIHSIHWGYTPIPEARTPAEELPTLDRWARVQDTVPWYRFVGEDEGRAGPYILDALDDDDPVRSAGFGLRNLRRVLRFLDEVQWRLGGNAAAELADYYEVALNLWRNQQRRVVAMLGGLVIHRKEGSQPGRVYTPLPASRQREAMRFLDSTVFRTPRWLVDAKVLRRLEPGGSTVRALMLQRQILDEIFDPERLHRLAEAEVTASDPSRVYGLSELLTDLRHSVWTELAEPRISIDAYRQGLQRAYVSRVVQVVRPSPTSEAPPSAYETALARAELVALCDALANATARAADPATRAHLGASQDLLERALGTTHMHSVPVSRKPQEGVSTPNPAGALRQHDAPGDR